MSLFSILGSIRTHCDAFGANVEGVLVEGCQAHISGCRLGIGCSEEQEHESRHERCERRISQATHDFDLFFVGHDGLDRTSIRANSTTRGAAGFAGVWAAHLWQFRSGQHTP